SYRISYAVDGVTQFAGPFTVGAGGAGVQSWAWYLRGWFAAPGAHTVTVTVDADNSVAETNESDNTRTFTFTPASATDLPQKFIIPLGGTPFQTWGIVNYLDVDPRAGSARDFRGGPYQYDGHTGIDMTLADFASMDAGVPVFAAAAGTVVAVHDGEFDRNTTTNGSPANVVEIDHGQGWHTFYYHFRTSTILVQAGSTV